MHHPISYQEKSRREFLRLALGASSLRVCESSARRRTELEGPRSCDAIQVVVKDLRKSGPERDEVATYLDLLARHWLRGSSAAFFGGEKLVRDYVAELLKYNLLAVGKIENLSDSNLTINAFVSTCGSSIPAGEAAWVVNVDGAFFPDLRRCGISRSELAASRVTMLLHEMGHALSAPGIRPDLKDHKIGENNTRIVKMHCQDTIDAAARWFGGKL